MLLSQSKEMLAHSAIVIVIIDENAVALSCLCQHWQMQALVSKQKVLHRIMLLQKEADLAPLLHCVRVSATVCMCVCYNVYMCLQQCVCVSATVCLCVCYSMSLCFNSVFPCN